MPIAYSYIRFSRPSQKEESNRRQTEARNLWLAAHTAVRLDTTLVLSDEGRSGHKRTEEQFDTYALGKFIRQVEAGRVERGSYLLLESLDRLSREEVDTAILRLLALTDGGIIVVTFMPSVVEIQKPVNMQQLILAIVEFSRGYSESKTKSERCRAAREGMRKAARNGFKIGRTPGWVSYTEVGRDGKDRPIRKINTDTNTPEIKTVQYIFELCLSGMGCRSIAQHLNANKIPVIGRKQYKHWTDGIVRTILTSRAVLGEFAQHRSPTEEEIEDAKQKGTKLPKFVDAGVLRNYYPIIIDKSDFLKVQEALHGRLTRKAGRVGKHVNLFSGLLTNARDGGSLSYSHTPGRLSQLMSTAFMQGKSKDYTSFQSDIFEKVILEGMLELKVQNLQEGVIQSSRSSELHKHKASLEQLIKFWSSQMEDTSILDLVAGNLKKFRTQLKEIVQELDNIERQEANPIPARLNNFQSVVSMLEQDNSPAMRERVKYAVRQLVTEIKCMFFSRGRGYRTTIAIALVYFYGGAMRCYSIVNTTKRGKHPASHAAKCFRLEDPHSVDWLFLTGLGEGLLGENREQLIQALE